MSSEAKPSVPGIDGKQHVVRLLTFQHSILNYSHSRTGKVGVVGSDWMND